MKNEFTLAFNEVLEEKQLPKEIIIEAIEAAMVSAYRRAVNASNAQQVEAKIDPETGKVIIFAEKEIVETVQDSRTEVSITDAQRYEKDAKIGSMIVVETTPKDFGRVAAQTARQVIQQRIREAERDAQLDYFSNQLGEIVSGVVQAISQQSISLGLDMKAEGVMPRNQQIGGERFRLHDRVRALLLEVKSSPRGPQLVLSRSHRNFLRRLLENEVPEIYHGLVEIRSIAREPGQRSKVAVSALQPGVDPVGACVGIRGVRIQAIVRELNDEKIDVIEWNPDPAVFIAKALSPARVTGVYLNEHSRGTKTATVVVPEDQLSLAIGRDGQNARLAAKLTSWRIDIKSLPEAAGDALHKLQVDPEFALIAQREAGNLAQIELILTKKSEGRPITPEEYSLLSQFVERVERGIIGQRLAQKKSEKEQRDAIISAIPELAFETSIDDLNLSDRVTSVLADAGYITIGDLMLQMRTDSDSILKLNGIGPRAMTEIQAALDRLALPAVEPEAEAPVEIQLAAEEIAPEAYEISEVEAELIASLSEAETPIAEPEALSPTMPMVAEEAIAGQPVEPLAEQVELIAEPTMEPEHLEGVPALPVDEEEEEKAAVTFDEIFTLKPEVFEYVPEEEEEEEEEDGKKKKKKKKKFVEMEYDPDKDVMIVKRKRKRGGAEWDDQWEG
jgi:N utilization substance protein A